MKKTLLGLIAFITILLMPITAFAAKENGKCNIIVHYSDFIAPSESDNFTITFKDGTLVSATSKKDGAKKLLDYIESFNDKTMYKPGEFGIGLNKISQIRGICYIEDESVYGTFHLGMGRNIALGGKQQAAGHFDIVTHKPNIYVDDMLIMKNGEIFI